MNLSKIFIERPIMTTLLMVFILFFGIFAYRAIPISDLPSVDFPTIQVTVNYPGANPETMANSIATPLEQNFMTIDGLQTLFSMSNTGTSNIVLQFGLGKDINAAATDVESEISATLPQLPKNLPNNPTYQKVNPTATPILYFAVICPTMTLGKLYDYANTFIGNHLSMVEGVSQVQSFGSPYAVRVQVDPQKLAAKNIGFDQVVNTIKAGNVDISTGTLYGKRDDFTVDVDGQIFNAAGYNELILKNEEGTLLKIKDIGNALDSLKNDKYFMNYVTPEKTSPAIILAIKRRAGANTIDVIDGVNKILKELSPQLPAGLEINRVYDQSETIIEGINDLKTTLFIAFILVVCIIFISLGKAMNTLIPVLALPIAVLGTFPVMYLFGFSLDILSMLAITLSIGFLVDDAIVVLENTVRHVQLGKPAKEAALIGAKEISITVLTITLCLVAAFIPLIFMSGIVGRLFREFAITITIAVLVSGFVSLTLTPMLASLWLKPYDINRKTRMERFSEKINERLLGIYEPCLKWALGHPITMISIGFSSIIASFFLFVTVPKDFLPPDDVGFLQGFTLSRDGTSPFLMNDYHKEINAIAIDDPSVESMISVASYTNPNEGLLFVRMKPFKNRPNMYKVIDELSKKVHNVVGINVYLSPLPLINLSIGTTVQALYQYSLTSLDRDTLYEFAPTLIQQMATDPIFAQVSSDLRNKQPQWDLHILRDRASYFNVTADQIENVFNYAYSTNKISQINAPINQYDVIVETLPEFYRNPAVLSKLYVRSTTENLVPLSEILEVKETAGPLTVNHLNGISEVTISFNLGEGVSLGQAVQRIEEITSGTTMPAGVVGHVQGTADIFSSSFKSLIFFFPLAFFVIYILLGILYESFVHPLTVMSALPPTLLGGLLTLLVFGETISIYSFVGLILLMGIVLKNGILMVDFAIEKREKEGKSGYDAIVEACLIRFRPILMTTIAAMMGAVPIALGIGGAMAQNHKGLGLTIVGGLIISQTLTLLLTPVLYHLFEELQEKIQKKNESKTDIKP
jgi:HAE1 family hydrophobic/amphiphilic exporter-1